MKSVTLKFNKKPVEVKIKNGNYELIEKHQQVYLVVDAFAGEEIMVYF